MRIKPITDIKAPNFTLYKDKTYPIVYETKDVYYVRIMNIKFGIEKRLEHDMYEIIKW